MKIYCCGCCKDVEARFTYGSEVKPRRPDLHYLPFWICNTCSNFVGCHHKIKGSTRPLGCIPTPEIRNARAYIHKLLDPLWKSGKIGRGELYKKISDNIGWKYHTADIRTVEEAKRVYKVVLEIKKRYY